jgi:hypothetical protein
MMRELAKLLKDLHVDFDEHENRVRYEHAA